MVYFFGVTYPFFEELKDLHNQYKVAGLGVLHYQSINMLPKFWSSVFY